MGLLTPKGGDGANAPITPSKGARGAEITRRGQARHGRTSPAREDGISSYLHGTSGSETGDTRRP